MPKTAMRMPQVRNRFCHFSDICSRIVALTTALSKEREISRTARTAQIKRVESAASIVPPLGSVAAILTRESKGLLIGEGMEPEAVAVILDKARRASGVRGAKNIFTVHLAPEQVVVSLAVDFDDALSAAEVKWIAGDISREICRAYPAVRKVLVTPGDGACSVPPRRHQSSPGR